LNAVTPLQTHIGYTSNAVRSDKDNEYSVFARVTHLLRRAMDGAPMQERMAAVHKNNDLWTILAADLAHPGNSLPDRLKAELMSLAIFSIRHGHAVMGGSATIDALIDVNMAMMRGLRQEAPA
jgi:flagellar protein FlaF